MQEDSETDLEPQRDTALSDPTSIKALDQCFQIYRKSQSTLIISVNIFLQPFDE